MRKVRRRSLVVCAAAIVGVASLAVVPSAVHADTGMTGEVVDALDAVDARNDNLVVEAAPAKTDADSVAQTANVDIPADPTRGVRLRGRDGKSLIIHMPGVRKGHKGKKAHNGTVVYGSSGDSVNVAIPGANGEVQMWSHIRNREAPEMYRYCVDGVTFAMSPDGGAVGVDATNQPAVFVPPPTATEKKTGKAVATSYSADGNCIVQHVAHKAEGTSYPVLADPYVSYTPLRWWPNNVKFGDRWIVYFDRNETGSIAGAGAGSAVKLLQRGGLPGWVASIAAGGLGWGAQQAVSQSGKCLTAQVDLLWGWLVNVSAWVRNC